MANEERCEKCIFFHRLKHNFQKGKGFQESYACDVLMHLPNSKHTGDFNVDPWIQEVDTHGMCEMFTEVKQDKPTTKNDLAQERYQDLIEYFGDEKVAKTILESRKEFKAWLERIRWNVNRVDELDGELEQIKGTTKNDIGVDCISREQALVAIRNLYPSMPRVDFNGSLRKWVDKYKPYIECDDAIKELPSITPQEPRWIPVSERLPEPYMFVNATCRSLVDDREDWVVETIYLPIPKEANKHGYSDWGNIPMLNWGEAEVIAWVERVIPQPYKADRSEEE